MCDYSNRNHRSYYFWPYLAKCVFLISESLPLYNKIKTSSKKSLQASKTLKIIQAEDKWEDLVSSDLEKETSHSMETDGNEELPQFALGDLPL
ncbi:hypothetical protein O181_056399 [Austropuccinia psidii MF-1]|uniref:Uncharacterized protein n=1 Tax=Austropuccinia psidii MF-1 TaxID=1389203 RepID=A0A9Q3HVL7_9BASI|nr:hypothetical protein [Austropuccinia psidii MF-1]